MRGSRFFLIRRKPISTQRKTPERVTRAGQFTEFYFWQDDLKPI